ncbi:FAD-binding oxidoreductase [uncultured Acinetobacter sp.]|uniref:flavin reductase family protein n=1 Tax=uncultured Acinetobacter sp. TaxID=165433 RepID=UPI00260BD941|nr:FAD-binding oxidoreductase [uncultured Acinetobacter sp.]
MTNITTYRPHWVREDFIDFIGEKIHPTWALKRVKAEVIKIQAVSPDFFKIQLRPNRNFKGRLFQAGQHIAVTVALDGIHHQRHYSIVTILTNGDILIAVRQQGKVSRALSLMQLGAVIELSQAQGNFTLGDSDRPLLFLASGSGITAIYSLLQKAVVQSLEPIDLIYFTRDNAFHAELKTLALMHPNFEYHHFNTIEHAQHLNQTLLRKRVPDFEKREIYACGSDSMMKAALRIVAKFDLQPHFHTEYFQLITDKKVKAQPVQFLRSQQAFQADSNLLESAEQAGLKPAHGCRRGICNTCSCTKVSGSVRNLLTGELDHAHNTQIKLCISQAVSPVVINL